MFMSFNGFCEAGMKSSLQRVATEEAPKHVIIGNESMSNGIFTSDVEPIVFKRTLLFSVDLKVIGCIN